MAVWPAHADYQTKTDRQIPVVVLDPDRLTPPPVSEPAARRQNSAGSAVSSAAAGPPGTRSSCAQRSGSPLSTPLPKR